MSAYNKSYKTCVRDEEDEEKLYRQGLSENKREEETLHDQDSSAIGENGEKTDEQVLPSDMKGSTASTDASTYAHDLFVSEFKKRYFDGAEFESIEQLRKDVQDFAAPFNIIMTTGGSSIKNGRLNMICKHGSTYRSGKKKEPKAAATKNQQVKKNIKKRVTVTSKLDCPCFVYGRKRPNGKVTTRSSEATHNHHIAADPRIYHMNRRMTKEELDSAINLLEHRTPGDALQVNKLMF